METAKAEVANAETANAKAEVARAEVARIEVARNETAMAEAARTAKAEVARAAKAEALNKFPRKGRTRRVMQIRDQGSVIYAIAEGQVIQLIRQDGDKFIAKDGKYDFSLTREDFAELD